MRRTHLLASIAGALALGLLTAGAQAAPWQLGGVEKSVTAQTNLLTLIGHGGGGHGGGGHGGGGGHMGGGHFGGGHFHGGHFGGFHGGHFAGGHFHGHHHGHFHGFGLWGWPWPYYTYSNCWWSPRYHRLVCPWY